MLLVKPCERSFFLEYLSTLTLMDAQKFANNFARLDFLIEVISFNQQAPLRQHFISANIMLSLVKKTYQKRIFFSGPLRIGEIFKKNYAMLNVGQ